MLDGKADELYESLLFHLTDMAKRASRELVVEIARMAKPLYDEAEPLYRR